MKMKFNAKRFTRNMFVLAGVATITQLVVWYITALINQYIGYINYING
jgi:hypothetical protein